MSDKSWKAFERRVARFFGCRDRNPLSGANSKHTASDTLNPQLFIEAKQRKAFSVVNLWDRCKALSRKEGKLPVVALSHKGRPGFWLLVHSSDLLAVANQRELAAKEGSE